MRVTNPHRRAQDARTQAAATRAQADELRSVSVNDAARRIEAQRAAEDEAQRRAAERARRLQSPLPMPRRSDPHSQGPSRGL